MAKPYSLIVLGTIHLERPQILRDFWPLIENFLTLVANFGIPIFVKQLLRNRINV